MAHFNNLWDVLEQNTVSKIDRHQPNRRQEGKTSKKNFRQSVGE